MAHKSHKASKKEDGKTKPLADIVKNIRVNPKEDRPFILIEMNENPAPPERSQFFIFVEQLATRLGLTQPSFIFTTKEIEICFHSSILLFSWNSFVKGLKSFLFPAGDKESGIIIDTEMLRLLSFPL